MLRFRLHAAPSRALPLNIRSAGHYVLPPGHRELRAPGRFLQLFWCVAGSGRFVVGESTFPVRPGQIFFHLAGEPHDLLAGREGWEYRWLTFDGEHYDAIPATYALRRPHAAGPCPVALFDALDACLRDPAAEGELRASVLGYEILLRASAAAPVEPDASASGRELAATAKAWLDARFTDARLNVSTLAARLRIHRASLHRVFKTHYGVPPVQYLARLRLRLALELLADSRLPVADVAVRCGLPDAAHFSKLISRHTGLSPRAYRRHSPLAARAKDS